MLREGENPKELLIEECKPQCKFWKEKMERCEAKLEHIIKVNPTKTCMYPFRDYVTCIEACVQPVIHNQLVGTDWALVQPRSTQELSCMNLWTLLPKNTNSKII